MCSVASPPRCRRRARSRTAVAWVRRGRRAGLETHRHGTPRSSDGGCLRDAAGGATATSTLVVADACGARLWAAGAAPALGEQGLGVRRRGWVAARAGRAGRVHGARLPPIICILDRHADVHARSSLHL